MGQASSQPRRRPGTRRPGEPALPEFEQLLRAADRLPFETHDIAKAIDAEGHYEVSIEPRFPFVIKLFLFRSRRFTPGSTWHERLELFLPLDGPCQFRMGQHMLQLSRGEMLVVDNLAMHHVVDIPSLKTRVIVISFLPEFVYSLGSPSHDYAFLVPFFMKMDGQPEILRSADAEAPAVFAAMTRLLECYFQNPGGHYREAGCKAYFLVLLYHLASRFHSVEVLRSEFLRQQERSQRFRKLLEHVRDHYNERISIAQAARLACLSEPQFMKLFKATAGMTFVDYLTRVRLAKAHQLLRESTCSIAAVASQAGFADQSYFDKRFKEYFGQTPREYRAQAGSGPPLVSSKK